jgi:hypothetical protein
VLDSDVSHRMKRWFRIPDAALGAFAYLGDAVLGLAHQPKPAIAVSRQHRLRLTRGV